MSAVPVLTFRLHDQRYGLMIDNVIEVMAMVAVEPISGADAAVIGMVNRHGVPMPLLDLRIIASKPAPPADSSALFIVVAHGEHIAGMIVDEIYQVEYAARLNAAPQGTPFVKGIFTERGRITQVLSVETVLERFLRDESEGERL